MDLLETKQSFWNVRKVPVRIVRRNAFAWIAFGDTAFGVQFSPEQANDVSALARQIAADLIAAADEADAETSGELQEAAE